MSLSHIQPDDEKVSRPSHRQSEQWYDASVWNILRFICKVWLANLVLATPVIVLLLLDSWRRRY